MNWSNTLYVLGLCFSIIFGSIQSSSYLNFGSFFLNSLELGTEYRTQIYQQQQEEQQTQTDLADKTKSQDSKLFWASTQNNQHYMTNIYSDDFKQLDCMATAVWFEARGETKEGQAAVVKVILNRVRAGFAKTPCEVVEQVFYRYNPHTETLVRLCQFDYYCKKNWQSLITANSDIFRNIVSLVYGIVKHGEYSDIIPEHAVYFHSAHIRPNWLYQKFGLVGNNVFYTDPKLLTTKLNTE